MRKHLRAAVDVLLRIVELAGAAEGTPEFGAYLRRANGAHVRTHVLAERAFGFDEAGQQLGLDALALGRFQDPVGKLGSRFAANTPRGAHLLAELDDFGLTDNAVVGHGLGHGVVLGALRRDHVADSQAEKGEHKNHRRMGAERGVYADRHAPCRPTQGRALQRAEESRQAIPDRGLSGFFSQPKRHETLSEYSVYDVSVLPVIRVTSRRLLPAGSANCFETLLEPASRILPAVCHVL